MHLGRKDDIIALRKFLQRTANLLLTRAKGINVRRVEEVNAFFDGMADHRVRLLFTHDPLVQPALRIAKAHTSKTNARDFQPRLAKFYILHL